MSKPSGSYNGRRNFRLENNLKTVAKFLIMASLAVMILGVLHFRYGGYCPYCTTYEGRIIDKFTHATETDEGSYLKRYLRIKGENGAEFQVVVSFNLYEKAQVGMWISNSPAQGVRVSWSRSRKPIPNTNVPFMSGDVDR